MKKILLTLVAVFSFTIVLGQNEYKYSLSTMQFLSVRDGEVEKPQNRRVDPSLFGPLSPINMFNDPVLMNNPRLLNKTMNIADTEIVNGKEMISAFIKVKDGNFSGLEGLGVVVQSEFKSMVAALIPVDKIEDVAALSNVTNIEVAEVLEVYNDRQRSFTQAGDAISNSAAAQALGLTKQYTGKNVILGIIDTGIDFQHIAFKDANGNSRIVRAYKLSGSTSTSLTTYSSASQINNLTYDTNAEDHGTHTSTTAGGSSVIVNGTNVTVTNDHANATYGGMAPEANLVIAGLSSLYTTSIGTAIQNICNYADQQGKPCVISLSLGSQAGPHDGTGTIADIVNQYAGNNHIIVYASSNDAMRADYFVQAGTSNGGGMYASGVASNSKPLLANLQKAWTNADGNVQLYASTIHAYARTANTAISMKFRVVDTTTGDVVYSSSAYSSSTTISMTGSSGLAQYFKSQSGYYNPYGDNAIIRIVRGQDSSSGKYYFTIYTPLLVSTSYDDSDGDGVYNSKYALCVSFYPTNGSTIVDIWDGSQVNWFGNDLTLSSNYANGYTIAYGNDECSVSDNACYPKVISVGAYVTKNSITDYAGTVHDFSEDYPNIGDHASFSSWQTEGYGPLGTALPHISAPGARIVAGINHYHTASVDDYSYWGDYFISDLVVNNSNYAYGAMEGTSMATPCVSGIIAQWLEACVEKGITPTPDYIKEVMAATWDTDEWTNGTGAGAHGARTFGTHGKINAIKGLQYILGVTAEPTITASEEELNFNCNEGKTQTLTMTVAGTSLEGNINAAITNDDNHVFSVSPTTITKQADGTANATVSVTFSPTVGGEYLGELTLSSANAESVSVSLYGKADVPDLVVDPTTLSFNIGAGTTETKQFSILGTNLNGDVTLTLSGDSEFSLSSTTATKAEAENGKNFTVTFNPAEEGNYSATVTIATEGVVNKTVTVNGVATKGWFDLTVSQYGVSTLYTDIDLKVPYSAYDGDILGVYYGSEYDLDGGELRLRRVGNYIPANTGVIVMANSGSYRFPKATIEVNPLSGNVLSGVLENTPVSNFSGTVLTLGMGSNGYIGFYRYSGTTLRANSAFIEIPEGSAKTMNALSIVMGGGESTAISNLFGNVNAEAEQPWYTLQGLKLNGKPLQPGLYIHNGKTVIIK